MKYEKNAVKSIYFIGIKGVGMAGLAIIAKEAGFLVKGSDISEEFLTDSVLSRHGISIDEGFDTLAIAAFAGSSPAEILVIATAAHDGLSNPQAQWAKEKNIPILTHGQAVGEFMDGGLLHREFKGISVLGCHGKTTVTAMTAIALREVSLDPTYTVGTSEIFPSGDAGHLGKSEFFVAEADEFVSDMKIDKTVKFLYQYPEWAIINNIDFDHPDVYADLEEVKSTFLKFCVDNIKEGGKLIINSDDENTMSILPELISQRKTLDIITYGEGKEADIVISDYKELGWGSTFNAARHGADLGQFSLSVPGYYNAKNSLGVIALLMALGIDLSNIKKAVSAFKGTKRRQEILGKTKGGAIVIDDYAHHPEEIEKTIGAIKKAYPGKNIIALFQPHTLSRTESLQHEFANAFVGTGNTIMLPIFTSKREGEVNYEALYKSIEQEMQKNGTHVVFMEDFRSGEELEFSPFFLDQNRAPVIKYIQDRYDTNEFVLVTLGAGDIYKLAYDMVDK